MGKIVDCYLVDEDKETANIIIELKNGICLEFSDIKFKGKDLIFYKLVSVNECCIMYTELYDDYNFQHSICWDRIIDTNFVYEIIDNADWILKKSLSYPLIRTYLYDNRIFFDEVKVSDDFIEINNGTIKKYFRIERDYI